MLVRQTNVVWLLFLAGTLMLNELARIGAFVYVHVYLCMCTYIHVYVYVYVLLMCIFSMYVSIYVCRDRDVTLREFRTFVMALSAHKTHLLLLTWPLLLPVAGLAYFVLRVNGGSVVLGDREQHAPQLHGAMLAYLCLLHTLFMLPVYLTRLLDMLHLTGMNVCMCMFMCVLLNVYV